MVEPKTGCKDKTPEEIKQEQIQKRIEILTTQHQNLLQQIDQIDKQREQLLNKRNNLSLDVAVIEGRIAERMEDKKSGNN